MTFDGKYYRMVPAHNVVAHDPKIFSHKSDDDLYEKNELLNYIDSLGIFERNLAEFVGREIEEISVLLNKIDMQ